MARVPALPTFLIIGASRSGSRWLRFNLSRHPDVFLPPHALDYFAPAVPAFEGPPFGDARRTPRGGRRWYELQFVPADEAPCRGECSPGYLARANRPATTAVRIDEALPEVRLLAVVRQPVDRMYSAMVRAIATGRLPVGTDLVELVESNGPEVEALDLVGGGAYTTDLYPFVKRFGPRLAVFTLDEIAARPDQVYRAALDHIGASPDFVPPDLERVLFSNGPRPELAPELDLASRQRLYHRFRTEVDELEVLLDRDLSAWDPGPMPFSLPAS
jgi:hypothetical protein